MQNINSNNYSKSELDHFNQYAYEWWDIQGSFKTLHQINPLRLKFIQSHINLANKKVLDVGCGGGILSDSMAKLGSDVMAIDMAEELIHIAKLHSLESKVNINYQCISIENMAQNPEYHSSFDVITCLEMLEHVPQPISIISSCAKLIKPNGLVFFSTINRSLKSYLLAILAGEYILKMLPKGTHDYTKLIKPSELAMWCEHNNLSPIEFKGIGYNLLFNTFYLQKSVDINYMLVCKPI